MHMTKIARISLALSLTAGLSCAQTKTFDLPTFNRASDPFRPPFHNILEDPSQVLDGILVTE